MIGALIIMQKAAHSEVAFFVYFKSPAYDFYIKKFYQNFVVSEKERTFAAHFQVLRRGLCPANIHLFS